MPTTPVAPTTATPASLGLLPDRAAPRWTSGGAELERRVQRLDGLRARGRRRITQEILIGEVEIISMLMSSPARVSNTWAATPGCERIPAPTIETLPISWSVSISADPEVGLNRLERLLGGAQVLGARS